MKNVKSRTVWGEFLPAREGACCSMVALTGNPNVGKSTVFNALTGLRQHTGNWPGKTVGCAQGMYRHGAEEWRLVDLPGAYSLRTCSSEEEIARDFLLGARPDAVIVVCDATCLARNLLFCLQVMELIPRVVVCVNLMDEAEKKGIAVDLRVLEARLGAPVVGTSARGKRGLAALTDACASVLRGEGDARFAEPSGGAQRGLFLRDGTGPGEEAGVCQTEDAVMAELLGRAESIYQAAVTVGNPAAHARDRRLDRLLTSKKTGIPVMLLLLCLVFWLTIAGANVPSRLLSAGLFRLQDLLTALFARASAPDWLHGALVLGVYRVLAWVVSVMLPPMAIFFPLFTLLEDFGYLPRVAFNLDFCFQKACACGKQALTMCMGFGCNAAGVTGCRIIDSPRERLIAILTNSFVPCNGRFPTLIAVISMFFLGSVEGFAATLLSALILLGVIVLGITLTFWISRLLSQTILKGEASSFALELPPYRMPQVGRVIVRSLLDRTLFVLGRAVAIAAPAGLFIWILANVRVGEGSLLAHCAAFLEPFGRLLGLDGVIVFAFILGFPANEIVVPLIIMSYMSAGSILEPGSLAELRALLIAHGWTWGTAVSVMLFCLCHWPCSTTFLTVRREAGGMKWALLSAVIPTAVGVVLCLVFTSAVRLLGLVSP